MGIRKIVESRLFDRLPKTELLIIQPSPFCNLQCRYCYLPDKDNKMKMSEETLKLTIEKFFNSPFSGDRVTIVWHAGEPMAVPISYYENAFRIIDRLNKNNVQITHNFQTNATTINDKWCEFIKREDVKVGVSIDGPQEIHDFNRVDRKGRGSFNRAMQGIDLLKKHGIPFSVIAVLTPAALEKPNEMFGFFYSLNPTGIGFNPEEQEGENRNQSLGLDQVLGLEKFYKSFLKLNLKAETPLNIRYFPVDKDRSERPFQKRVWPSRFGNQTNTPFSILTIAANGDFSTFSPELIGQSIDGYNRFVFGNVHRNQLVDMIYDKYFLKTYLEIYKGKKMCSLECKYFQSCRGGAPSEKLGANGSFNSTESLNCKLTKQVPSKVVDEYLNRPQMRII